MIPKFFKLSPFKKVAFIQYPVTDVLKARHFYEEVLGFERVYENESFQWFEYDINGVTFAITNSVPGQQPGARGAVLAIEVTHLDLTVQELRAQSVQIATEPFSTPVCRIAEIADPDGNRICLHQLIDEES